MNKIKEYIFGFYKDEKYHTAVIHSQHLQGAVRKLLQMYDVDNLVKFSEVKG